MSCSCALCTHFRIPKRSTGTGGGGINGGGGGGGSASSFSLPAQTAESVNPNRGLNKPGRLEQERNEAIEDDIIPSLNPRFPYRVIAPPLDYFRFPANPPEALAGD